MKIALKIREEMGDDWIPVIYQKKIRPLRTRSVELDVPERENFPSILITLLGVELKIGRKRFACPNIETARYLLCFTRAGCRKVAVPYDITKIGPMADLLENAWGKMDALIARYAIDFTPQTRGRLRSRLTKEIREDIEKIGAGELMPLFDKQTKQRKTA